MNDTMITIPKGKPCELAGKWEGGYGSMRDVIIMSCPKCGELVSLHKHTIQMDGNASPEVKCVCGWSSNVKLEDWV